MGVGIKTLRSFMLDFILMLIIYFLDLDLDSGWGFGSTDHNSRLMYELKSLGTYLLISWITLMQCCRR